MKTLGVDLAAEPNNTAVCCVTWTTDGAHVEPPKTHINDTELLDRIQLADKVGIDAPFGWPDEFIAALVAHQSFGRWPGNDRKPLSLRETDRVVKDRTTCNPLSVSADKIAACAMRCAYLLDQLSIAGIAVDRTGEGRVAEVYPAAALRHWKLPFQQYKGPNGDKVRRDLVARLLKSAPWLRLAAETQRGLEESDHKLDALVAALVARAVAIGATFKPDSETRLDRARREGWIHIPTGSIESLSSQSAVR